jgi:triosephosphate isomerase
MANRLPLMAGNWKMNCDHVEATGLVQKLAWTLADLRYDKTKCEALVLVPYTDIRTVQLLIEGDKYPIGWGAQDVSTHDSGAYTGEVSAPMLAKLNCAYVVVGHSERRDYHGETDAIVNAKAKKVLEFGMTPIICVGEKLDIRQAGTHVEFVLGQVDGVLAGFTPDEVASVVIAYEPVWAIGTGEVATPADAQEVIGAIRQRVRELAGSEAAAAIRIQYGGSAKASNIVELMAEPDIDGALVGGASLKGEEFAQMVTFYARS